MSPSRSAKSTAVSPDSLNPIQAPAPQPTSASRLFAPTPSPDLSIPEAGTSGSLGQDAGTPSLSTSAPDDQGPAAPAEPSATRSTGSPVALSKAGIRAAVGTGFKQVCRMAAAFIALEEERQLGVWTPDDDDVQDVARHASNLLYRRLPDDAKGGDMVDVLGLGLALAGYVGKSLQRRAYVRRSMAAQTDHEDAVPAP
jgi:hypothetical protein